MLNLVPYRKHQDLMSVKDTFDKFFDDFFDDKFFRDDFFAPITKHTAGMTVDILDKGENYELIADLPGFAKEDIHIEVKDNHLVIVAQKSNEKEESTDTFIRQERSYGKVQRSFYLGDLDPENIEAKFENGVLNIKLQKRAQEEPKMIEIH